MRTREQIKLEKIRRKERRRLKMEKKERKKNSAKKNDHCKQVNGFFHLNITILSKRPKTFKGMGGGIFT